MKKCLIMPDSFKGTMSSLEICQIMAERILYHYPQCQVLTIPVADGGEGTVDSFIHAIGAKPVHLTVTGPWGQPTEVYYARHGRTAIIEMAQAAGLPLVGEQRNPELTTTVGVGEMIRHAAENGSKEIIIGLGGSCTNDAGAGAATALGVRFLDTKGEEFIPDGSTLDKIAHIDTEAADNLLAGCTLKAMCDIDNSMFGPEGAAFVFAPQKGADQAMVERLDSKLRYLAEIIKQDLGLNVGQMPGAGAAGAMGAGLVAFLGFSLQPGIQTILDLIEFEELAADADLLLTGEGRIDGQSLRGKVVIGIAERARQLGVPVVAIVGTIGEDAEKAYEMGVHSIFSINRAAMAFEESRHFSQANLAATIDSLMRYQKIFDRA